MKSLSIGLTKIYELFNEGELKTFKVGRKTLVTTESIRAFVDRQLEQQEPQNG